MSVEPDREARAIMRDAQGEEVKHFSMDVEFLLRRTPLWREIAEGILFQEGDIVEHGEEAEEEATEEEAARGAPLSGGESLGIGGPGGGGGGGPPPPAPRPPPPGGRGGPPPPAAGGRRA